MNIYAPNDDNPGFFEGIFDILINEFPDKDYVLTGDFNLVLDKNLDRTNNILSNKRAVSLLNDKIDNLDLIDIWRILNPLKRRYTWRRNNHSSQSRIDFFLISLSLEGFVKKTDILPGFKSDHSLITLKIEIYDRKRGPGFWRFNCSLLHDVDYVNHIKNKIRGTVNENRDIMDSVQLWEYIKYVIKDTTIQYSKSKQQERVALQKQLETNIKNLEVDLMRQYDQEKNNALDLTKQELESIIDYKTKGAIL